MAKYNPLGITLARSRGEEHRLSISAINGMVVGGLPPSAFGPQRVRFWQNEDEHGRHVQARAWRNAGFYVERLDGEVVIFRRR